MIHPNLAEEIAIGVSVLGTAGVGIRNLFAEAARKVTRRKIAPALAEFKISENKLFCSLDEKAREPVKELLDFAKVSEEGRVAAVTAASQMKVPAQGQRESMGALQGDIETVRTSMLYAFGKTYNRKISGLIKDQVEHRAGKTAEQLADMPPLPLSAVDARIVEGLDKIGIIDLNVAIHEFAADHLPDFALDAADLLGDLLFPGAISGGKAVFREGKMLLNGETDLGDALIHGILPAAAKTGLVGTGLAIDASLGFASLGFFTATGYALSHLIKTTGPQDAIKEDVATIRPYLVRIQDRKNQAVGTINDTIASSFGDFPALTRNCPSVVNDPKMRLFVDQVTQHYNDDAHTAAGIIEKARDDNVAALPRRNWVDYILFINRHSEAKASFNHAARVMVGHIHEASADFASRAYNNPKGLAAALLDKPVFLSGKVAQDLAVLPDRLQEIQVGYFRSIEQWKVRCLEKWTAGMAHVNATTKKEGDAVEAVTRDMNAIMESPRTRIRANLRRIGKDPDLCP